MDIQLDIQNRSERKRLYRKDTLHELAETVCSREGLDGYAEVSVLMCDDPFMTELNKSYRNKRGPTDVLSFEQAPQQREQIRLLGDIVISLETVERNCGGERALMREEIRLLFCHGLLHLLGYDHGTAKERTLMNEKQAQYLEIPRNAAWQFGPKTKRARSERHDGGGGIH